MLTCYQICDLQTFSPTLQVTFLVLSIMLLGAHKFLILSKSNLFIVSSVVFAFGVLSKRNHYQIHDVFPLLSSEHCIILILVFWYLGHLRFLKMMIHKDPLHSHVWGYPIFSVLLVEKIPFPIKYFSTLLK